MNGREQRYRGAAELFLAGAGSFAVEVADWAGAAGMPVAGLIDLHDGERAGTELGGIPVFGPDVAGDGRGVAIAAGGDRRAHWELIVERGWQPRSVVHPGAALSPSARLEAGVVVGPGAVVGAQSTIGVHSLISRGTLVGHHVEIEGFVSLLPGANVASNTRIGGGATVGMGAVVTDHTAIGSEAVVAAGAVVLGDVTGGTRVQGVPARPFAQ